MKNCKYYILLFLVLAVVLMPMFMTGCASEADKRIKRSESLYRQSIEKAENLYREYTDEIDLMMAQIRLKKVLSEYQKIVDNYPNHAEDIGYALYQMWDENYKPPEPAKPNYEAAGLILEKLLQENFQEAIWPSVVKNELWVIAYDQKDKHNYEDARIAYQELVDNFPYDVQATIAWYSLGEANYKLQKYEETRKAFRVFISKSRVLNSYMGRESRRLIAQSYLDESPKNYNQAYLNFDKLTTAEFKDNTKLQAEAMYKAAHCLLRLEVNDEALGRYAEFMTRFPDSEYVTDAYFDLGVFYAYNKKEYEKDYKLAHFHYNRALQSPESPNHSKAKIQLQIGHTYYDMGRTNYNLGNFEKASSHFEKASNVYNLLVQEYPDSEEGFEARLFLGTIHRKEKRADEAIHVFEDIIANHSKKRESLNFSYSIDEEFSLWSNLIALSYGEIGQAFAEKKDFERAFNSYYRIVKKPDGEETDYREDQIAPFALHKAMVALCELGRKDELETFATTYINAFGAISELSRDELILSAEAQLKFADVLHEELNQYDKAAAEYVKLQDYPPKPYLRLNLIKLRGKYQEGLCRENGTTPDKSVETYQEAIRLFKSIFKPLVDNPNIDVPNVPEEHFHYCIRTARYYAGNSYFATNQFEKAIVEFEEFLKTSNPESEMTKTARDKIEKARRKLGIKAVHLKSSSDTLGKSDTSVKSETAKNLTHEQKLAQRASESTVYLTMESTDPEKIGIGTGFFVRSDLIATNHHVIEGSIGGTARLVGTKMSYAIVGYTAVDPDRDLAILKVRAFGVKPLPLGNSEEVKQGETVYPVGNPRGLVNVISNGKISSIQWVESIRGLLNNRSELVSDVRQKDTPHKLLMMTAPISKGNSGGPVLNSKGEVLGISVGGDTVGQNLNFAVPVSYLITLLKRTGSPKLLSDLEIVY